MQLCNGCGMCRKSSLCQTGLVLRPWYCAAVNPFWVAWSKRKTDVFLRYVTEKNWPSWSGRKSHRNQAKFHTLSLIPRSAPVTVPRCELISPNVTCVMQNVSTSSCTNCVDNRNANLDILLELRCNRRSVYYGKYDPAFLDCFKDFFRIIFPTHLSATLGERALLPIYLPLIFCVFASDNSMTLLIYCVLT